MIVFLILGIIYMITVTVTVTVTVVMLLLLTRPTLVINNVFRLTYAMQLYGFGEKLLRQIQAFMEWSGKHREATALCLDLRATLHNAGGQYEEAEGFHKHALVLYRQLLQDDGNDMIVQPFVIAAEDYASLLEITGRPGEAAAMLRETAAALQDYRFDDKAQVLNLRAQKLIS